MSYSPRMDEDIGHLVLIKEEVDEDDDVDNPYPDGTTVKEEINTDAIGEADPLSDKIEFEETSQPQVKEEPVNDVSNTSMVVTSPKNEETNDPNWSGSSSEYSSNDDFYNVERVRPPKTGKKNPRTITGIKQYTCNVCDYVFSSSVDLRRHIRTHTGEKPFKCEICDSRFTQACHRKVHMRTHTGEKQFSCDVCGFKCNRASNLKTHKIRAHTGLKPYSCEVCGQRFKLRGDLDRHVRTHTGEKPFPCDLCDSKFTQAGHLRVHIRTHTGEKPFACELCDYKCTRPKMLRTHMAKVHSQGVS